MGVSASSLLDDNKSDYIKGEAKAELKEFSPYYRKQFSVAQFSQVEDDLQQHKEKVTQLLKQREVPEEGEVLYEEAVLYFDDTRKWRDRYIVARANYSLECHESLESFFKGSPAFHKLLPTGGTVLITEEKYMAMVNKCFPDDSNVKEDFVPPLSGMPGQFPVYLRLPYRRDSYFCFKQQAKRDAFISILSDCIRHQNQDFLKRKTCEVQAFLKAIQLYRQNKGKYEDWNMLIGSDVRVMANVVMERLIPSLEKDILPRLKAKKTEKKRVWFATVEAAYILAQEHLLEGLSALKEECRATVRQQEMLIHSDMDQILSSRRKLEEKVRDCVSEQAKKLCTESVQPYLSTVLEELMEPISSGFQEGRQMSEKMMDMCQDVLTGGDSEQLKKSLDDLMRPNLLSCYQKISSLQEKMQHLQDRFGFSNVAGVIHSAQIDLQLLMENAAYTFEQLLMKAMQDNPDNASSATEKAKHRVLKQYDYDSSTVRKRIFQEALVSITLPFIKKNLAPTCKTDLQGLEQSIDADHSNFIHVENVYEQILLQILDAEVTKVVKEAASLKKYNLFTDSRDLVSQSSRSSLPSPSVSTPGSPAMALASPSKPTLESQLPSPLVSSGLCSSRQMEEQQQEKENGGLQREASTAMTVAEIPLGKVEETEPAQSATLCQEKEISVHKSKEIIQTMKAEPDAPVSLETTVLADTAALNETQETKVAVEGMIQDRGTSFETEQVDVADEAVTPSIDAPKEVGAALAETPAVAQSSKTDAEGAAEKTEAAGASTDPVSQPLTTSAEGTCSQLEAGTKGDKERKSSEAKLEAPSSGEALALAPEAVGLDRTGNEAEQATVSDPRSLDVSVRSESPPSDVESTEEEIRVMQSITEDISTTSDVLEEDHDVSSSPMSPDDMHEDTSMRNELPPQTQTKDVSREVSVSTNIGSGASANAASAHPPTSLSTEPATQDTLSSPEARPPDCIKNIRDLVVEVIEVEELAQRYPSGVLKDDKSITMDP